MNFLFLIGGAILLSVFLLILAKSLKHHEEKSIARIIQSLFAIGIIQLILAILSFLWAFKVLTYSPSDFLIIYSICIIIQTMLLFRINYTFVLHTRIIYLFISYIVLSILIFIIFSSLILSLILSFLISLLLFIEFTFRDDVYAKVGFIGIIYSAASLAISILYLFKIVDIYLITLSSTILFYFILVLFSDFKKYPISQLNVEAKKEKPYFLTLLSHLIFIITFINFILIGTIAIHEFGHYAMSEIYDCEYGKIIYEDGLFRTEFLCQDSSSTLGAALGGILLPIIIAILLFSIGGNLMKEIAVLITGFNLIAISRDILLINLSENISTLSIIAGAILSITGIFFLAKSRSAEIIYS